MNRSLRRWLILAVALCSIILYAGLPAQAWADTPPGRSCECPPVTGPPAFVVATPALPGVPRLVVAVRADPLFICVLDFDGVPNCIDPELPI